MSLWITYTPHYQTGGRPYESSPTQYSKVAVFDTELEALRYANEVGAKCTDILPQETLADAIKRSRLG